MPTDVERGTEVGVDAELQPILDLIAAVESPPMMEAGPAEARATFDLLCAAFGPGDPSVRADDIVLSGRAGPIPARRYRPDGTDDSKLLPTLVFLHGGGFVIGSLDTHDALCRSLSAGAGIAVVSVGYRLAPESPAPAAVEDVTDALDEVVHRAGELGVDPTRLAVGGDSAGGNLAALAAVHHRDRCRDDEALAPLRLQLLIYPVVDLTHFDGQYPSFVENADGYLLTSEAMEFFEHNYLGGPLSPAASSPAVSPMHVVDLSGCAPAFVLTAEYDPLRDEGEAYARRLEDSGVDVTLRRYDGAIHMFVQMDAITGIGARAVADCVTSLRGAMHGDSG